MAGAEALRGARSSDDWSVEIDPGVYDPVLGTSYQSFARLGLSFQRSQNGGRFVPQPGAAPVYYTRITAPPPAATPATTPAQDDQRAPTRTNCGEPDSAAGRPSGQPAPPKPRRHEHSPERRRTLGATPRTPHGERRLAAARARRRAAPTITATSAPPTRRGRRSALRAAGREGVGVLRRD